MAVIRKARCTPRSIWWRKSTVSTIRRFRLNRSRAKNRTTDRVSSHKKRQKLAREYGATDIVTERGDDGVDRIKELTQGIGADSVLECVGTREAMAQAIHSTRPGGYVGFVGVPHGV